MPKRQVTEKPFWKEAALELDFETGKGMIQTEHRCVQEDGLGQEHEQGGISGEGT